MKIPHSAHLTLLFSAYIVIFSLSQLSNAAPAKGDMAAPTSLFTEALQDFPRNEENLRKWGTPVVADLDQDGYPDLLLNDHGFSLKLYWNNKGRYAKAYDLIVGDVHGVTVGDYDFDGLLEVIIARGGGSGSNARNAKIFRIGRDRSISTVPDFKQPLAFMRGRTSKLFDGNNDGALDLLDFAFPSADKKDLSENYIYTNNGEGELVLSSKLALKVRGDGQKTLITDFNNDNKVDLLVYGFDKVSVHRGRGDATFDDVSQDVLPFEITDVTSIVEFDFDNDGDFDVYLSRGKEFEAGETFFDRETDTWAAYVKRGAHQFQDLIGGDVVSVENFQAPWPNKSFFIGESAYKYEFPGETHSGKDFRLVNSDALGFPDKPDAMGAYIGYVGNSAWRVRLDNWSPVSLVIHGIENYPAYEHSKGLQDILLENQNGKYVDVSKKAGIGIDEHTTGVTSADIDNNGFEDLVVIRRGNLVRANETLVFFNQGDSTFKSARNHGIVAAQLGSIGLGVEQLDYNLDGFVDIVFGNDRGKWQLFKNNPLKNGSANFLTVDVGNSKSKKATALGAVIKINACGVKQQRRVGSSGAMYARSFNKLVHFGLGSCKGPVGVNVSWTNGETETRQFKRVNAIQRVGY